MQRARRILTTALLCAPALAALAPAAPAGAVGSTTYYVAPGGSDSASGTSPSRPWRTLARASYASLRPGDQLLLRGGSTFAGGQDGLTVTSGGTSSRPVVVGSYGTGSATISGSGDACLTMRGSWVRVKGLAVDHCTWAGVEVIGDHVTVGTLDASWSWAGVQVDSGASYTTVQNSGIHDNVRTTPGTNGPNDDSGAFGVLVNGDHTTISGNDIRRQDAPSPDYGRDGAGVEVFGARETLVEDNVGAGNQTFVEVGGLSDAPADDVLIQGNTVTNSGQRKFFAVAHAGDTFGWVSGVDVVKNHVSLTGAESVGVLCGPQCTARVLYLSGNAISAAKAPIEIHGTYGGH